MSQGLHTLSARFFKLLAHCFLALAEGFGSV